MGSTGSGERRAAELRALCYERLEDRLLFRQAADDGAAFEQLYRRHVSAIRNYFRRALGEPDAVDDLTADTFLVALTELPRFQPTSVPPAAWLFAIARNRLRNLIRLRQIEARLIAAVQSEMTHQSDPQAAQAAPRTFPPFGSFICLVEQLPRDQREAIRARYLNAQPYARIAAEAGVAEETIRKRVSRGLRQLRTEWLAQEGVTSSESPTALYQGRKRSDEPAAFYSRYYGIDPTSNKSGGHC